MAWTCVRTADDGVRLLAFLRERSYREGTFRLSSGATSSFYIDCKLTTYDPRGFEMIGRVMHAQLVALGLRVDGVGGLTMGPDPIALAIGVESVRSGRPLRVFSVRKDAKSHGTKKLVEGGRAAVEKEGVAFHPVFTIDDLRASARRA
ncbi:MAG: hypothetical protein HYR85_21690 [Planctomycetes bacterium]|nr:hypothetical protein [Planctomycetota bacterium]MBI3848590.1 hypothetical protein [Planctomycetota bacterium]